MTNTDDSFVRLSDGATTYAGADAVTLFRAHMIRSAIRLWLDTGLKANRAWTPTNMRLAAERITGKPYSRGKQGLWRAYDDLGIWLSTMKTALPIVDARGDRHG
jgi:hypothetical protein